MKHDYNSIFGVKMQGIIYNTDFPRWEYYGANPIIRAGEPQPEFVSEDLDKCIAYKMAVERT